MQARFAVRVGPIVAILCFVTATLYPLVLLGRALYFGDLFLYFYPLETAIHRSLGHGEIPLWNAMALCGQPVVGNPQASIFYPSALLLAMLPVWLFFTVNAFLHLAIAGWGAYLYLRRLTADRLSAILGAVIFAGSGFIVARLQFPTIVQTAAWLPWMLLVIDRIIERPRPAYGVAFATVSALTLLAGHAQIAYMSFACAAIYAIVRLVQIRRHMDRVRKALVELCGFLMLGILAASVQLLPMVQLFTLSTREHLEWKEANRFVLQPAQLVNFIIPNWFGSPQHGDYWGSGNAWEPCVYVGLLPLALAGYALLMGVKRRATRFFGVIGLLALWLSLGRFGGLYFLAYYLVPGIASFHDPARFNFLATFAIAALAAIGLRRLRDAGVANYWRVAIMGIAMVQLAWNASGLNPSVPPGSLDFRPSAVAKLPQPGEGRTFYAFGPDMWKRYASYADYGPQTDARAKEMARTLLPNLGVTLGFEEANSYEPVPIKTAWEANGLVYDAVERHDPELDRRMQMVNARSLLLPGGMRYHHPGLRPSLSDASKGLVAQSPGPRVWLTRKWKRIDGTQRGLNAIAAPRFAAGSDSVVAGTVPLQHLSGDRHGDDAPHASSPSPGSQSGWARIDEQDDGRAIIRAHCGPEPTLLVWSQAFYPGWKATLDARDSRVATVNSAYLGIVLPPGDHTVRLRFEPFTFKVGLYLSLAAVSIILAALCFDDRARGLAHSGANLGT